MQTAREACRSAARPARSLEEDCAAIERALLVLARFTGGRRQHQRTIERAGLHHVETWRERRARRVKAVARRAADLNYRLITDPAAFATPVCLPAAELVDAGLYPVLAIVEDLIRPRPIDIARALTLERSTIGRHLDRLEARGLVFRHRGWAIPRSPRICLTVEGFNAMTALRRARIARLAAVVAPWPALERRLTVLCTERLAAALHDDCEAQPLPGELTGTGTEAPERLPALLLRGPRMPPSRLDR